MASCCCQGVGLWSGCYADDDLADRDAGNLCGLPPTGVTATSDVDQILALGADCMLYMPAATDLDQVCAILAAGTNIVTTREGFPPSRQHAA